jgi:uncharacterized protein YchJ
MKQCGIASRLVTSDTMGHAWNAVEIDGSWYYLDLTYDDAVFAYSNASPSDAFDVVDHAHFLMSEDLLKNSIYTQTADGEDEYYNGWAQTDITADATTYDQAAWHSVSNEYGYCDGNWYYLDSTTFEVMKTADPTQAGAVFSSLVKEAAGTWPVTETPGYLYNDTFGKVSVQSSTKTLYLSTANQVLSLDLTQENPTPLLVTTYNGVGNIYGLSVIGDILYMGIASSPQEKETLVPVSPSEPMLGDTDGNNKITAEDALEILKSVVGNPASYFVAANADFDGKDGITADDALAILKYVVSH